MDEKILSARDDQDTAIAEIARTVIDQLKIKPMATDGSPNISTMSLAEAAKKAVAMKGDVSLGNRFSPKQTALPATRFAKTKFKKDRFLEPSRKRTSDLTWPSRFWNRAKRSPKALPPILF